jgi:hypothetical protein
MVKMLSEIFRDAAALPTRDERIQELVRNDSPALRILLYVAFHPEIEWMIPQGAPPYKPNVLEWDQEGQLYREVRKLYLFLGSNKVFHEHVSPNIRPSKRETAFIRVLETISKEDAEFLIALKDKKLALDPQDARDAFPGILD